MKSYKKRIMEYEQLRKLFSLKENAEITGHVIDLIRADQYDITSEAFYESFQHAKHAKMLTPYTLEDFQKMQTYKLEGYNIGFALKKFKDKGYSEIVAVHNAEPEVKGIGPTLMDSAIRNGGLYLDHFDGFLTGLYEKAGFIEYARDKYDPQYDPDGSFRNLYGEADIIYRHHHSVEAPV